jgi:hypothetical protein
MSFVLVQVIVGGLLLGAVQLNPNSEVDTGNSKIR